MKSSNKILSLALIIVLLFSTLSAAFSINAEIIEGTDYEIIWNLDTDSGTLTLSGEGTIYRFSQWRDYKNSIKKVVIDSDSSKIYEGAFTGYNNLSEVEIPDTLTDIGFGAFYGTPFLNSLPIKNHQVCLGDRLLDVEDFCGSITVNQDIKHICGGAFSDKQQITSITIPEGVISIGDIAFEHCTVKNMVIPDSVTSIGYGAFRECPFLETIILSKNITLIENNTFFACYRLKDIVIPDGVTTIEYEAFLACENLEEIYIPTTVTNIGARAFDYCPKLTITCYEDSYAHRFALENGIPYRLLDVSVKEKGMQFEISNLEAVKSIRYAYGEYDTEKDIKYGVDSVSHSAKTLRTRGDSCTLQFPKPGLVSIVITYNDGTRDFHKYEVIKSSPTVTRDGGNNITFGNLNDLKVLRYVKGEYESSYDIKRADGSVAISGKTLTSDTYTITLERETYTFCVQYNDESYNYYVTGICGDNLTWVYDMQSATLTVSGEGEMDDYGYGHTPWFGFTSEIQSVQVNDGVTALCDCAFCECSLLESVSLPPTLEKIGGEAFYDCYSLKSIVIPDSVTYISSHTFCNCINLESVVIGNGVQKIRTCAFEGCTNLKNVVFGSAIKSISDYAFRGCESLNDIDIPDSVEEIGMAVFSDTGYYNNQENWTNNVLYLDGHLITAGSNLTCIIKNGTKTIASYAFENSRADVIYIPESISYIAFGGLVTGNMQFGIWPDTVLKVVEGSYAEQYLVDLSAKGEEYYYEYFNPSDIYG